MSTQVHYVGVVIFLTAVLLTGCAAGPKPAATQPAVAQPAAEQQAAGMAPEAQAYLDELLGLLQAHSINRLKIDWTDFRAKVYARANGAKSIEDTRPAITEALNLLGDRHSFYLPKSAGGTLSTSGTTDSQSVAVPSTVGYIKVGAFAGTPAEAAAFADRIQQTIKAADGPAVTGWIVDLRGNGGGNMWPMITGLAPILGEGPLGYFIDPTGAKSFWELRDGVAYLDGQPTGQPKAAYQLQNEAQRVAVLTDGRTGSSGEAVTIAFRGRPGARSFGTATYGLSTANAGYPLSDGAMLWLTVAVMADRTGAPYGGPVVPDEATQNPVERAIEWLQTGQ